MRCATLFLPLPRHTLIFACAASCIAGVARSAIAAGPSQEHQLTGYISTARLCAIAVPVYATSSPVSARAQRGNGASLGPGVAALMDSVGASYAQIESYSHMELDSATDSAHRHVTAQPMVFGLNVERPNKLRFVQLAKGAGSPDADHMYCDGETLTDYRAQLGQFTRSRAALSFGTMHADRSISPFAACSAFVVRLFEGTSPWPDNAEKISLGRVVKDSGLEYDTVTTTSQALSVQYRTSYYFDRRSHLLHKIRTEITGRLMGHPVEGSATSTVTNVTPGAHVPNSSFELPPTVVAREVPAFVVDAQAEPPPNAARLIGAAAPDFSAPGNSGNTVSLASFRGKVVIIEFWASWCGPCTQLMPVLQEMSGALASQGVVVLAVDSMDAREDSRAFLMQHPDITLTTLFDPAQMSAELSIATTLFGVDSLPTTLVIDRTGIIRTYAVGVHDKAFYLNALKDVGIKVDGK